MGGLSGIVFGIVYGIIHSMYTQISYRKPILIKFDANSFASRGTLYLKSGKFEYALSDF